MIYRDFKGKKLSLLGFGAMRLPLNEDESIDEALTAEMVAHAIEHGVNYLIQRILIMVECQKS